jgi:anti-anti-sigma factor
MKTGDDFVVGITWRDGTAYVTLAGEWDLYARDRLHDALASLGSKHDVIVDVRRATFFDSTALAELISFYKRVTQQGHRLEVLTGNSNMERLLDLTGLRRLLVPPPDRLKHLSTIMRP